MGEIGTQDTTWLRINQVTNKNIYTPRYIRADAGFFVDGTTKGIDGSGNFIGGTIAGASDYGTLLRSDASDQYNGQTAGRVLTFRCVDGRNAANSTGGLFPLQVYQNSNVTNSDAAMTFHIAGRHATYFGLDRETNDLFVGGWSKGAAKYKIWHAGNDGSGSGLDADLLDGINSGGFLRSNAADSWSGTLSWGPNNTHGLSFQNSSYTGNYLYIGGWTSANTNGISRIRNSNANLHLDSGANGNLYLNQYSTGTVYARGSVVWHAGNDGAGSGLDADRLHGLLPNFAVVGNTVALRTNVGDIYQRFSHALGYASRAGTNASGFNNIFNIHWANNNTANLWIDNSNIGPIQQSSDYRIKRNVETITESAIDRVKKLRPIKYQFKDYGIYKSTDEIHEGFIAHELAEVIPSAVNGEKDDPDTIQSLKFGAIIAVLTKAIQEQQETIENMQKTIDDLNTRIN
jgi:hypothetical protein